MKDLSSHFVWYLINVYSPNARAPWANLWVSLANFIKYSVIYFLMMAGDFNSPLHPFEKSRGIEDYLESMNDLADFISIIGMMYIHLARSNKRVGQNLIQVRLDRVLVSGNWKNIDSLSLCALPRSSSDHITNFLSSYGNTRKKSYPFRYEIMWSLHRYFGSLVEQWWNVPISSIPMYRVAQKLKILRTKVKGWNHYSFGNIFEPKKVISANLETIQRKIEDNTTSQEDCM